MSRILCWFGLHAKRMRYVGGFYPGRAAGATHYVIVCARPGCKHMEYGGKVI